MFPRTCCAFLVTGLAFACFRPSLLHAQTPAPKPAGISCSLRHTPLSAGDESLRVGKFDDALKLYQTESQNKTEDGQRARNIAIHLQLRSGDTEAASKEAHSWLAEAPTNPWAQDAVANLEFREGKIDDAGTAYRAVLGSNFCNAQAHADYSEYLDFSGYHASAKNQIEIARKLDSVDPWIHSLWVDDQPRNVQATELGTFLTGTPSLPPERRKQLERLHTELSGPAPYPCTLVTPTTSVTIPFHAMHNHNATNGQPSDVEWGLQVNIDGTNRRLEIDSGASGITLTKAAAASMGLHADYESQVSGVDADALAPIAVAKVRDIKINGLEFQDCSVEVLEQDVKITQWDADVSAMEGVDGLIGSDVFQNFLVTLDFPGRQMKLDPLPPLPTGSTAPAAMSTGQDKTESLTDRYIAPSMASWVKVFREGHELFLPVRINSGPVGLFLVDTGAGIEEVSTPTAKRLGKLQHGSDATIVGVTGEVKNVDSTGPLTLDFGGLRQPTLGLYASDLRHLSSLTNVDGMLGQKTLHQLTIQIDYRDQLMHFTYDPSRVAHCMLNVTIDDCYD